MTEAWICDGVRTPFGRYGGSLSRIRADDLAALPLRALLERHPRVDWAALDDVVLGCANQAGEDNRNVARMAALLAGLPDSVGGVTVNRLCGSGLDAFAIAARAVRTGETSLAVAGGVESMSRAPFVLGKSDAAFARDIAFHDTTIGWRFVNPALQTRYGTDSMPETAENVAERYRISREDQDAFALRSQQRALAAQRDGTLAEEIVPVRVPATAKGEVVRIEHDEHPRETSAPALARLRAPFRNPGTVTAGNASGVNDGSCALLVASDKAAVQHGLQPLARVVGAATVGVEPRFMGIGPVPATRRLLEHAGVPLSRVGVIEVNEAFAAQALAVLRELGLPDDAPHVNRHGGAIALGHPLGASGARLALTAVRQLVRRRERYALCTMCIGVGQGIALLLERP